MPLFVVPYNTVIVSIMRKSFGLFAESILQRTMSPHLSIVSQFQNISQ